MPDEETERKYAAQMLEASRLTRHAVDELRLSIESRHESIDGEIKGLRREIKDVSRILVGERGDNGVASRVLLLERQTGLVSWQSVSVIVALVLAAAGMYLGRG